MEISTRGSRFLRAIFFCHPLFSFRCVFFVFFFFGFGSFFSVSFRRSRTRSMVNGEVSGMKNLANDRLRYGVLGDVYGSIRPVDFLNAHVVQFLEGSQSVVGHFQR